MRKASKPNPHKIWLAIFGVWAFGLTGIFSGPGVIQAVRLHNLLSTRQQELTRIQSDIARIDTDSRSLRDNPVVQEREIRKVLGYAAPDELIFDFSPGYGSGHDSGNPI